MEIKEVDWGLANNYGDYIEIHKCLKQFPELYNQILEHEKAHEQGKFTAKDFMLDIGPSKVNSWKLLKYMCIYPKTFLQFAPFFFHKSPEGKWEFVYDMSTCIVWALLLGIIITIVISFT